jgi:hypothetical protein
MVDLALLCEVYAVHNHAVVDAAAAGSGSHELLVAGDTLHLLEDATTGHKFSCLQAMSILTTNHTMSILICFPTSTYRLSPTKHISHHDIHITMIHTHTPYPSLRP